MFSGREPFRVFVSLGTEACPSGCRYCYLPQGHCVPFSVAEILEGLSLLPYRQGFIPGQHGTVITFGGHSDLFLNRTLVSHFLDALALVASWANPIQISTKQYLPAPLLAAIAGRLSRPEQLSLFVSCSTISQAALIEPGSPPPALRFRSFGHLREAGLLGCLLIKPWLSGLSAADSARFAEVVHQYEIPAVCAGSLYVSDPVRTQLGIDIKGEEQPGVRHPLMAADHVALSAPTAQLLPFSRMLAPAPLFRSSLCVSAHFYDRACPIHPRSCGVPESA